MTHLDLLRSAVGKILLNDWDPVGVRDVAAAQDEYDQYVDPIVQMVVAGEPASVLSRYRLVSRLRPWV